MFLILAFGRQRHVYLCVTENRYSTEQVPEQPYLHKEVVSGKKQKQKDKKQNKTKKKKKMNEWLWSS